MKLRKRFFSAILIIAFILTLMPVSALAADGGTSSSPLFSDMPDNWSTKALQNAVANGLIGGSDGKIMPEDNLTRAEMATVIARALRRGLIRRH